MDSEEKDRFYLADLLNSAKRRGDVGGFYEEAVARLYRVIELVAQIRLKERGFDASELDLERVPSELRERWVSEDKRKISLYDCYALLGALGDQLGSRFSGDKGLRNLLSARNSGVMGHGVEPVEEKVYRDLYDKGIEYSKCCVSEIHELLKDSEYVLTNRF